MVVVGEKDERDNGVLSLSQKLNR